MRLKYLEKSSEEFQPELWERPPEEQQFVKINSGKTENMDTLQEHVEAVPYKG